MEIFLGLYIYKAGVFFFAFTAFLHECGHIFIRVGEKAATWEASRRSFSPAKMHSQTPIHKLGVFLYVIYRSALKLARIRR